MQQQVALIASFVAGLDASSHDNPNSSKIEGIGSRPAGLILVAPTCAASDSEANSALEILEFVRKEAGFCEIPVTLNLVNTGLIAIIISVLFHGWNTGSLFTAKQLSEDLLSQFSRLGFPLYRLSLGGSPFLPEPIPSRVRILRALKNACDAHDVLGFSKYEYLWQDPCIPSESIFNFHAIANR